MALDPGASGDESRELLDLLLSATNDGFVDWDLHTGVARYSPRWKMLLGYEEHELTESPDLWKTLSHPADLPRIEEMMTDHIENVWPFSDRWRMRHRNGDWRWMLCRSVIIRAHDGSPRRAVSVYTDITDQVRAEERYRALANGIPDAILRIRNDGLVLDEKPGCAALDLLNDGPVGRRLLDWAKDGGWAEKTLAAVATAARSGEVVVFEHSGGSGLCVEIRVVKSGEDEAVCIARDVTERKQAERRLIDSLERLHRTQRQLIEASHRAGMAEVASSVLHNVGNVLNSVNVSASAAREIVEGSHVDGVTKVVKLLRDHQADLGPFLTADPKGKRVIDFLDKLGEALRQEGTQVRGELDSLQKNIDHIKVIVSMQQSHARSHSGITERFPPADVIEDALKLVAGNWDTGGIELVRDFASIPEVEADRHKLLQILTNLLSNARQAMGESHNKVVTVRLLVQDGGRFAIDVHDTGMGISEDNLKKVFQHGFTTKKEGHGFGLHSSALAAKSMGGSLAAFSDGPGHGARFLVELPLRPPTSR
jgi:PAS domain S-box-containing protein